MLIQHHTRCQHRLPGIPQIHGFPLCGLTATGECKTPTYSACPRYEETEELCPICGGKFVKDTVDWSYVCPECGLEIFAGDQIGGTFEPAAKAAG